MVGVEVARVDVKMYPLGWGEDVAGLLGGSSFEGQGCDVEDDDQPDHAEDLQVEDGEEGEDGDDDAQFEDHDVGHHAQAFETAETST